jgi:hypothetical protein
MVGGAAEQDFLTRVLREGPRPFTSLRGCQPSPASNDFVEHVLKQDRHYDLHEVLIPDLKSIYRWLPKVPGAEPAARDLLEHCLLALRTATARPIEPPADWTREAALDCKCADCLELSRFLKDPEQRVGRFPLAKQRRQHLHQQIRRHHCDCTHVTERVGRPQTLVCTKTQASYERRLKQYHQDLKLLAELESLAGPSPKRALKRSSSRQTARR